MDKDFKTLFNETLNKYGVSIIKLSETSGIPERYIEAMRVGNTEQLPPDPYVRGYLAKIAELAGGNHEELWIAYKAWGGQKTSGAADRMPSNRYSLKKISKGKIVSALALVLVLVYGMIRFDTILGKPELVLRSPNETLSASAHDSILLEGEINSRDKLTVNGKNIVVENDGKFNIKWPLSLGMNTIEIKSKRFLGREKISVVKVIYIPPVEIAGAATSTPSLLPQ